MASNLREAFDAASQGITITLASLASGAARQSAAIDWSAILDFAMEIYLKITLQAGTPTGAKAINVYFAMSEDGTNFTDNASGSDATITLRSPTQLFGPYVIPCPDAGALAYKATIPDVAAFFNGHIPTKVAIIVENQTGVAFSATEGDHTKEYRGVYATAS